MRLQSAGVAGQISIEMKSNPSINSDATYLNLETPNLFFPDTTEGFVAKVHWSSFQFLMEQFVLEAGELIRATEAYAHALAKTGHMSH